jgi:hypothetical protein
MSNYYNKWKKILWGLGYIPGPSDVLRDDISAFVCRCCCSKKIEWFETSGHTEQWLEQHRTHEGQDIGIRVPGDTLPPTKDTEDLFMLFPENRYPVADDRFVFVRTKLEDKIELLQKFAKLTTTPSEIELAQRKINYLQKWLKSLNKQIRKSRY